MSPKYPNGVITRYSIQCDGRSIDPFGDYVSGKMIGEIDRLTPDTEYVIEMKACTRVGSGPPFSLPVRTCKLLKNVVIHISFSQVLKNINVIRYIHVHILRIKIHVVGNVKHFDIKLPYSTKLSRNNTFTVRSPCGVFTENFHVYIKTTSTSAKAL